MAGHDSPIIEEAASSTTLPLLSLPPELAELIGALKKNSRLLILWQQLQPISTVLREYAPLSSERIFLTWLYYRDPKKYPSLRAIYGEDLLVLAMFDPSVYTQLVFLLQQEENKDHYDKCAKVALINASPTVNSQTTNCQQRLLDRMIAELLVEDMILHPDAESTVEVVGLANLSQKFGSPLAFRQISILFARSIQTLQSESPIKEKLVAFETYCQAILKNTSFQPLVYFKLFELKMRYLMNTNPNIAIDLINQYVQGNQLEENEITQALQTVTQLLAQCNEESGTALHRIAEFVSMELKQFFEYLHFWAEQLSTPPVMLTSCGEELRLGGH